MKEKNYDFRARHWQYHRPGMRQQERGAAANEVELDGGWSLGCAPDAPRIVKDAVRDFQDYLLVSMNLSVRIVEASGPNTLFVTVDPELGRGFAFDAAKESLSVTLADESMAYR
ncbi:MAG: hypothetical protein MJ025_06525, partial [Victivallaceae bacterium]|nr:hypothetical protein [Victivallaceae bacterium]